MSASQRWFFSRAAVLLAIASSHASQTATPNANHEFRHWRIIDPNHPDDANYTVTDTNASTVITMSADHEVTAAFKCGGDEFYPLAVIGLLMLGLAAIRRLR